MVPKIVQGCNPIGTHKIISKMTEIIIYFQAC